MFGQLAYDSLQMFQRKKRIHLISIIPVLCLYFITSACQSVVEEAQAETLEEKPPAPSVSEEKTAKRQTKRIYFIPERSTGRRQSPINISSKAKKIKRKGRLKLNYKSTQGNIANLGHTVKANYKPGNSIKFKGKKYILKQYHFHTPAEHLVDGITYPLEMHLVHTYEKDPSQYLVIGILFKQGKKSPTIQSTIDAIEFEEVGTKVDTKLPNLRKLFRKDDGFYIYKGSLTTPPYSETVRWLVLDRVLQASSEQLKTLNKLEGNNARHIQSLKSRKIVHLN